MVNWLDERAVTRIHHAVAGGVLLLCIAIGLIASPAAAARRPSAPAPVFDVVALGVDGGVVEGTTSAWYIARRGSAQGLTCDAGTLVPGIRAGLRRNAFPGSRSASDVLHRRIAAYLITHPHLDHVAGMLMVAPDDVAKPIFALPEVNAVLANDYFNWRAWPNLSDRGPEPRVGRYHFTDLAPGAAPVAVAHTGLTVTAYPLAHSGGPSSAFLIRAGEDAVLCLGDTGPDAVERSDRMAQLWRAVAPLLRAGQLRAVIIEASYPDPRPDATLFGHLTPSRVRAELQFLGEAAGDVQLLRGLPVIISHIKPTIDGDPAIRATIRRQLEADNAAQIRYILPEQGRAMAF